MLHLDLRRRDSRKEWLLHLDLRRRKFFLVIVYQSRRNLV
jgi:hypothetical protein